MKYTFAIIGMLSATPVYAQTADPKADKLMKFGNNFSHENAICGAYALFVHQCLKSKESSDPLAAQYWTLGNNYLERAEQTGKVIGLSQKALMARVETAIEEMKDDTENSCVNISVLFRKHAKMCKALYDDGPQRLQRAVKEAQ